MFKVLWSFFIHSNYPMQALAKHRSKVGGGLITVVWFLFSIPVWAEEQSNSIPLRLDALSTSSLSLRQAIALAIEHNPALQLQKTQLQVEKSILLQNLSNYDPLLQFQLLRSVTQKPKEFIFQPSKTESFASELSLVSQLPTGTHLTFKSSLAQSEDDSTFTSVNPKSIAQLEFNFRQALLKGAIHLPERQKIRQLELEVQKSELFLRRMAEDLILQTAKAYFQCWISHELLNLAQSSEKDAKDFLDLTKNLKKKALREEEDLLRAEVSYLLRQSETLAARTELTNSFNSFLKVLHVSVSSEIIVNMEPKWTEEIDSFDAQASLIEALKKRTDFLANKIAMEGVRLNQLQFLAAKYPDLDLIGSYGFSGLKSSLSDSFSQSFSFPSWKIGFAFRYPFGARKGKGEQLMAESNFNRAKSNLESLSDTIAEGLSNSLNALKLARERFRIFQEIESKEKKLLEMMMRKYAQGRVSSLDILQSQESLRQKSVQLLHAKKTVAESYLYYQWQQGTLLEWQERKP